MNIYGRRVSLKAIQQEDLHFLMELYNDPVSGATLMGWGPPVSYAQQEKWFLGQQSSAVNVRFAVWRNDPEDIIGQCAFSALDMRNRMAQTNIRLSAAFIKQGLGSEAMYLLHLVGFDYLGLECIGTRYLSTNQGTEGLVRKLGLVKEGVLRSRIYKAGKHHDLVSASMTREEFEELRKKHDAGEI